MIVISIEIINSKIKAPAVAQNCHQASKRLVLILYLIYIINILTQLREE